MRHSRKRLPRLFLSALLTTGNYGLTKTISTLALLPEKVAGYIGGVFLFFARRLIITAVSLRLMIQMSLCSTAIRIVICGHVMEHWLLMRSIVQVIEVTRNFYALCAKIIEKGGYFLHKYTPSGSVASSWHPWLKDEKSQLPIQEDETALVIWALWNHYQ